jgi:hypothetical protein
MFIYWGGFPLSSPGNHKTNEYDFIIMILELMLRQVNPIRFDCGYVE